MKILLLLLGPASWAAPPEPPTLVAPADGDVDLEAPPTLSVSVSDPDGGALSVSFQARGQWTPGAAFTVVALPDTQYYACGCNGGSPETFVAQTAWVVETLTERDVAFVTLLGDCVENGDAVPAEWDVADEAFSLLEDPDTTGRAEGIPYGVAVGNHDQSPFGDPDGGTDLYNATFGVERFAQRSWYGGHRDDTNDDHYQLFEAGGTGYVVLHLEFDPAPGDDVLGWAQGVLDEHSDRLAIVVSHSLIDTSATWSSQGLAIHEALRDRPNLLLMLAGHSPGVAQRADTWGERTVHTVMSDYQGEANGGDGWLRVMTFHPGPDGDVGRIQVETWSPTRGEYDLGPEHSFVLDADLSPPFVAVGEAAAVSSGETASVVFSDAEHGAVYEWRAVVSDGTASAVSEVWSFGVGDGPAETGVVDSGATDSDRDSGTVDGTTDPGTPADSGGDDALSGGCGCAATAPVRGAPWWLALGVFGWLRSRQCRSG